MREIICICLLVFIPVSVAAGPAYDEDGLVARLSVEEREIIFGLQYLLNPFQQKQYLELPDRAAREAWIERFWLTLDPTPTTGRNERRTEHERRVLKARELFGTGIDPGWDRRGEIYIRFGEPTSRDIIPVEFDTYGAPSPPQELWYYGDLDMLVTFADQTHNGRFTHADGRVYSMSILWNYLSNGEAPVKSFSSIPGQGKNFEIMIDPFETNPYLAPDLETPNEALTEKLSFCHPSDTRPDRLPAYADVASFNAGGGMLLAEVGFEIPAAEVGFLTDQRGTRSGLELRVLVRDAGLDSIAFAGSLIESAPEELERTLVRNLLPARLRLTLRPGYYHVGMEVIDRYTGRSVSMRRNVRLDPLEPGLRMSDIQFAGRIGQTEEGGPFTRGSLEIVPHPSRVYVKPDPVVFYAEIYGLDTDREDVSFYSVEYAVEPVDRRRRGPVLAASAARIASRFETSGYGATQPVHLTIATGELWAGDFRLTVEVTDRRTRAVVSRSAVFSIQ